LRAELGRPTPREMDSKEKFSSKFHVRGENASSLTAGVSVADLDQIDPERFKIVGVIGNSMGWYTALGYAGALPMGDCATLIETLGQYQAGNIVGGQIVYPLVDDQWRVDPKRERLVEDVIESTEDLHWSIRLGGQAVIGGTEEALAAATARLPGLQLGTHSFPLRLPMHSAFHTPLMMPSAQRAQKEVGELAWGAPNTTMIDGRGKIWRPFHSDPSSLRDYTLGAQVTDAFDLRHCIRTALRTVAPDVIILPGPGSNLGSAVAQTLIMEGWAGITSRDDFIARQNHDPILLSMRWPDQRAQVVAG
jgi:[acyl-carrier-protein] S-malonyltransferase